MGLPPTFPDYAGGAACARCEDVIFEGKTPFYVEAWVFGINKCAAAGPAVAPDGIYLLSQIAPCTWQCTVGPTAFIWDLLAGRSNFFIGAVPVLWFNAMPLVECVDTFDNELICGPGAIFGTDGWVTVFWGPGIGP